MFRTAVAAVVAVVFAAAAFAQAPLVTPTRDADFVPPGPTRPSPFKADGTTPPTPLGLKPSGGSAVLRDLYQPGGVFTPDLGVPTSLKGSPFARLPVATLSTGAYPDERKRLATMAGTFPNLKDDYEVLGPRTGYPDFRQKPTPAGSYNCIAWTLGLKDRWVWPHEENKKARVKDFDAEYLAVGLTRRSHIDTSLEKGVRKVVLYGKIDGDGNLVLTHGAKQEVDGTWTSKLGGEALIRHRTPESVSGPDYGSPVAVYAGPR